MNGFRNFWSKSVNEYPIYKENANIKCNPYDTTNCFSKYALSYIWSLVLKGYNKPLTIDNLALSPIKHQLISCYNKFLNSVIPNETINNDIYYFTFDVAKTLLKMNKKLIIVCIFCMNTYCLLLIGGVFCFRELIGFLYDANAPICMGILWAILLSLSGIVSYFFMVRTLINAEKAGMISRNLLMSLLYRKLLKIPSYITENDNISNGEIVNTMSIGNSRIFMCLFAFNILI